MARVYQLGNDMTLKRVLHPLAMSATFNLFDMHAADMTLTDEEARDLPPHDIVQVTLPDGPELFRVSALDREAHGQTRVTLTQALDRMHDLVYQTNTTNFRQPVVTMLNDLVTAGTASLYYVRYTRGLGNKYFRRDELRYENRLDLFNELRKDLSEHYFIFEPSLTTSGMIQRIYVDVVPLPTGIEAEFRLSRNIEKCSWSIDDTDMCNRLHMLVQRSSASGSMPHFQFDDTASQALYGVIEQGVQVAEADLGAYTAANRQKWADNYFVKHAKPRLTVKVDGYQLHTLTGLDWDKASVGKMVRVALPDIGETFVERCMSVEYPNVIDQPERVTVTLGDTEDRISEELAFTAKKTGTTGSYQITRPISGKIVEEDE